MKPLQTAKWRSALQDTEDGLEPKYGLPTVYGSIKWKKIVLRTRVLFTICYSLFTPEDLSWWHLHLEPLSWVGHVLFIFLYTFIQFVYAASVSQPSLWTRVWGCCDKHGVLPHTWQWCSHGVTTETVDEVGSKVSLVTSCHSLETWLFCILSIISTDGLYLFLW